MCVFINIHEKKKMHNYYTPGDDSPHGGILLLLCPYVCMYVCSDITFSVKGFG